MFHRVKLQILSFAVRFSANAADERLLARVRPHVNLQADQLREGLLAHSTLKRPLTRVRSQMSD